MPVIREEPEVRREAVARIGDWFLAHGRALPWRDEQCSAWGVLVSEIMLQQTPVNRVLPVWEQWLERWPTPAALAECEQAEAVRAWGRLGYPRRAQRLWLCARALVEEHGGEVPSNESALRELPGIGEYTAAAVMAFAYGERTVVLDTNVRRVIGRVWSGRALPATHLTRAEWGEAAALVPADVPASVVWNAAAMELGALVCTARNPRCEACPVADACAWFAAGKPGLDEAPRRTQAWAGTDRQVRGRIIALLREASAPMLIEGHSGLADVEPGQVDRCLASLTADALITEQAGRPGFYSL